MHENGVDGYRFGHCTAKFFHAPSYIEEKSIATDLLHQSPPRCPRVAAVVEQLHHMEQESPCQQNRGLLLHVVHQQVRIGCNNIMCLHGKVVEDAQVRARMAAMAATIHLHWQWQVQNPKGTALICAWGRVMGNTWSSSSGEFMLQFFNKVVAPSTSQQGGLVLPPKSMAMQQEPKKMEVPIPYMFGLNFRGYPQKIWPEIWY